MIGKRNETRSTSLSYPMVELLTGAIMQLMYLNTLAVCCLLPLAVAIQSERVSSCASNGGVLRRE